MAQQKPPRGLTTFFTHVAYDLDLSQIGEQGNRRYLEYRIRQVEGWVAILHHKIEHLRRRVVSQSTELNSLLMDLAYLLAVRQALTESLNLLPATA
jgi:hypothetical protein